MNRPPDRSPSLLRGTGLVAALTLLSRILGFFRDVLIARLFGASILSDLFFVAFRIPNLLRSVVAEGAMTSAFVPVFSSELSQSKERAQLVFRAMSSVLLALSGLLTLLGIIFAEEVVTLMAPGLSTDAGTFALTVKLTRIMLPLICCVSLVAMINGALSSAYRFGASAWAQVAMNATLIVGALIAPLIAEEAQLDCLAWSVLIGGAVQVAVQLPALRREELSLLPGFPMFTPATKKILLLMLPALFGAALYQLTIFLNTMFASLLSEGSVSFLFYADRLVQLPIGVFSIALASVLLPLLSRSEAEGGREKSAQHLSTSLRFSTWIMIPCAVVLYVLALPLTRILFERGEFSSSDSLATARAIQAYAFGIWAVSAHSMLTRGFLAQKDTWTPTLLGVLSLAANALCSLMLMGPVVYGSGSSGIVTELQALLPARWDLGHAGLALASSISAWLVLVVSCLSLSSRYAIPWGEVMGSVIRSIIAAVPLWLILEMWTDVSELVLLGGVLPLAAALYFGTSFVLGSSEAKETFHALRRLRRRDISK